MNRDYTPLFAPLLAALAAAAAVFGALGCARAPALLDESDERPAVDVAVGARAHSRDAQLSVDGRVKLTDVVDAVALPDGRVLAQRTTELGQSDLWLVDVDGAGPPRALAAARGADALPLAVDGGARVLFVSDRTGVTSVWSVRLDGSELRQLTNVGERVGALSARFTPPPVRWLGVDDGVARYDAGDGDVCALNVADGSAR